LEDEQMTDEEKRAAIEAVREKFERTLKASKNTGPWNFATMLVNGVFSHYVDPDTDNAWLGWAMCHLNRNKA
jgi:hypothetical protein